MNELVSLAAEINREHNLAEQMAKTAIEHALKAGELLIQAKTQCGHGEWLSWVDNNLEIGPRQPHISLHQRGRSAANLHQAVGVTSAALCGCGRVRRTMCRVALGA